MKTMKAVVFKGKDRLRCIRTEHALTRKTRRSLWALSTNSANRRPTTPADGVREERLESKKWRSAVKHTRSGPGDKSV